MPPHRLDQYTPPELPGYNNLFEDDYLLVLSKDSGLLTVPGKDPAHADCLESRVQNIYPQARIVHRLDMSTSGLIIMAKGVDMLRQLSKQFEQRQVDKRYQAIIWGRITPEEGLIDMPIICDWPNRPIQKIDYDNGRQAITQWRVVERYDQSTRINLFPKTGRSHQLRLHMKEIGHPILGDNFYAHKKALAAAPRLMLHAEWLKFQHPITEELLEIKQEAKF
ncbi:MAG: pseudouridine synthase [bacterium]